MKTLSETYYTESKEAYSAFSDEPIEVIGEAVVELEDGRVIEQYLYNIVGYKPENGKPFSSLKANIAF